MLDLKIYQDPEAREPLETLHLGTTLLEDGYSGHGQPIELFVRNEGTATLVTANINLTGDGAESIQLARNENGVNGIWAQPGQGIVALTSDIKPGETFSFWARGAYTEDDAPERKDFNFSIEMVGRH